MSKQNNNRRKSNVSKSLNLELNRAVRNYNAKIDRLSKKDPQNKEALPEKVSVRALKEIIDTKQDLQAEINSLKRFTQRGAEKIVTITNDDYNLKITQWQKNESERIIKNANAKIDRLIKKDPKNAGAYPEKFDKNQFFKENIDTIGDLTRETTSLKKFTQRGSEELVTIPNRNKIKVTKWEKEYMETQAEEVNKNRAKRKAEIEDIEVSSGGKKLGYTRGDVGLGTLDETALDPINVFTESMDNSERKYKARQIRKESRANYFKEKEKRLKENYLKGIRENYNVNDPNVKAVIDEIENMDFKDFYKIFQAEDPTFEYASKLPPGTDLRAYAEHLKSSWAPEKAPQ